MIGAHVKTVRDLLQELARKFGTHVERHVYDSASHELAASIVILVNGHSIRMLRGIDTPLSPGDEVTMDTVDILETVGGG